MRLSGRCLPSAFGMYTRRDGSARYAPLLNVRVQISEVSFKVCLVRSPRQPVHAGCGVAFEREERLPEQVDAEAVEEVANFAPP